jgi:hypothetical protein
MDHVYLGLHLGEAGENETNYNFLVSKNVITLMEIVINCRSQNTSVSRVMCDGLMKVRFLTEAEIFL